MSKFAVVTRLLVGLSLVATSLALTPAIGAQAMTPTLSVSRISGQDRYATADSAAQAGYPSGAQIVFVATGSTYPDALAAGPVAAVKGGPLLLTTPNSLPSAVAGEIESLHPATIVIVGGTGAVSATVSNQLTTDVPAADVTRIGGANRFETAADIDEYGFPSAPTVYVATGDDYPDALSAAAAAGAHSEPVLLVNGTQSDLDQQTTQLISTLGVEHAKIVGGTAVVSSGIQSALDARLASTNVTRIAGADRYATSAAIATNAFTSATNIDVATGTDFPDAVAGSALAAHQGSPLFTVPGTCIPQQTLTDFATLGATSITLIGGAGAVSQAVATLAPCAGGPAQTTVMPTYVTSNSAQPSPPFLGLEAIDCVSATSCVAVGEDDARPLFARMTNGTWSTTVGALLTDSNDASGSSLFDAVSCASSTSCAAVGHYTNKAGLPIGLIETLSGSQWTATDIAPPAPAADYTGITLGSVSCGAVGSCMAVGDFGGGGGYANAGIAETLAGGVWRAQAPAANQPEGSGSGVALHSVSCTSATWCVAVGSPVSGIGSVIETFSFGAGNDQELSQPNQGLGSVSCVEQGVCTAAGSASISRTDNPLVLETLTNGDWISSQVPLPADSDGAGSPTEISCTTGNFCATYTDYGVMSGSVETTSPLLVVTGNGSAATSAVPLPAGSHGVMIGLSGISCGAPGSCIATGSYVDTTTHYADGVIETLANGIWRATGIPIPAGQFFVSETYMTGVSCVGAGLCETAGWRNYVTDNDFFVHFAGLAQSFRP